MRAFEAGEQDADALCSFCSQDPLPTTLPHVNELRDMEAWSESVTNTDRPQLWEARQLLMASRLRAPNDDAEVQSAVRLMEDLAVEQELRSAI